MRKRVDCPELISEVAYCDGYLYRISASLIPTTAYIKLSKEDTLFGATIDKIDATLKIHGGCTYSGFDDEHNSFWIGWDYGHAEDFVKGFPTLAEVREDVCNVVAQLQNRKTASRLYIS